MKLEDQVCSYELAKQLKELGINQDSEFYWTEMPTNEWSVFHSDMMSEINYKDVSAFTVAELGEMLPATIQFKSDDGSNLIFTDRLNFEKLSKKWWCYYFDGKHDPYINIDDNSEANVRAKMLIYLLENKLMEVPK